MEYISRKIGKKEILYAFCHVMHTRCDILLYAEGSAERMKSVCGKAEGLLARLEKEADRFNPESGLAAVNRGAGHSPISVSPELFDMIRLAICGPDRTCGLFDPTLLSEHHDRHMVEEVVLDEDSRTVRFRKAGMQIDLCGFAKGYALDRIRELLAAEGISDALVNLGNSSVMALGNSPEGDGWKVGYGADWNNGAVTLHDQFLTTSGNDTEDRRHITDPFSGKMKEGKGGVGVVSSNGADGEILSTSLFLADKGTRERILENFPGCECFELMTDNIK